jgi:hypothetical protein
VGDRPTRIKARNLVAVDSREEGNQVSGAYRQSHARVMSELPGRNESERIGGLENKEVWKPSLQLEGEGNMSKWKLADTLVSFQRGDSDSMVTRTYQETGEALLVPRRNSWRKDKLYNQ